MKEFTMLAKLKMNLVSKKLWVAVGSAITFAANGHWLPALITVLSYLGIQGIIDLKN
jgi:hypothetical protein